MISLPVYLLVGNSNFINPLLSIRLHLRQQAIQIPDHLGLDLIDLCEENAFFLYLLLRMPLLLD